MDQISSNKGKQLLLACVSLIYLFIIGGISVLSSLYTVSIPSKPLLTIALSLIGLLVISAMIYSRTHFITKFSCMLLLPCLLPTVLLNFHEWSLIVPLAVTCLLMFFFSGVAETPKTIFGTVYLLLYVLGSLGFFLAASLFSTKSISTTLESRVSNTGSYRYTLVNTEDSSGGSTKIEISPNDMDINFSVISFRAEGYERTVYIERPVQTEISLEWKTVSRQDVSNELNEISDEVIVDLPKETKTSLGYSEKADVYLRDLSDSTLKNLGVPDKTDVLYLNGEPCFRSYVAILEDYFSSSKRISSVF
ncbi:MAG: hypothetical protein K2H01_06585 [Ruminococcus sp.]|nr:hypothetical protein [Ruminococcus sp.]